MPDGVLPRLFAMESEMKFTPKIIRMVLVWLVAGLFGATGAFAEPHYRADDFTSLLLHFDEKGADEARDASEFENPCHVRGARWGRGRFGRALDFRNGGIAEVPFDASLSMGEELTLECWLWVAGPSQDIQRIAYRGSVYGFYLNPDGTGLTFYVNADDKWESLHAEVPQKQWVHLAGVYDGSEMRLYMDGDLRGSLKKTGQVAENGSPLYIGANARPGEWQLQGKVDEVRVSHVARQSFDPDARLHFESTTEFRPVRADMPRGRGKKPKEVTVVRGLVRDVNGERCARGVRVATEIESTRSGPLGYFTVRAPRGRTMIGLSDPRYDPRPLVGEMVLKDPRENLRITSLKPVNPYQYRFAIPGNGRGYRVTPISYLEAPEPDEAPSQDTLGASPELEAFATPGEYEPLSFVIYAREPLEGLRVEASPLRSGKDTIPAPEVFRVKRYFRRRKYNRPAYDGEFVSRYLLPFDSVDIGRYCFRQMWLTVQVPEDAPAGTYRGRVEVIPGNGKPTEIPISFEVLPFSLRDPGEKGYGCYYRPRHTEYPADQRDAIRRKELADIRAHGGDHLLGLWGIDIRKDGDSVQIDYEDLRNGFRELQDMGFEGPYIASDRLHHLARLLDLEADEVGESEKMRRVAERALQGLHRLRKEEGFPEIVVAHMDEVFNRGRLPLYIALTKVIRRVAPELRVYITIHSRPDPTVRRMTRRIDPYVDLRCYHGHSIGLWMAAGHRIEELERELKESGDEAWTYYNPRSILVTPECMRIVNGVWLWMMPIKVHLPWCYNSYSGDPLDDGDGHDYGFAFPVDGEIVSTRLWEAYREGVDDMRYIVTLEELIEERRDDPEAKATCRKAQAWLDGLRKRLLSLPLEEEQSALVKAIDQRHRETDYDGWRRECARWIEALK